MSSPVHLDSFPEDIWSVILSQLPDCRSRLRMEAVSRRMNRLAKRHAWTCIRSFEYRPNGEPCANNGSLRLNDSERLPMRTAESESALLHFFCFSDRDFRVQWINIKLWMMCPEIDGEKKMVEEAVANLEIIFRGLQRSVDEGKPKVHFAGTFGHFFPSSIVSLLHSISFQIRGLVLDISSTPISSEMLGSLWKMIEDCQNLELIGNQLEFGRSKQSVEQMEKALHGKPITRLDIMPEPLFVSSEALFRVLQNFCRPLEDFRWIPKLCGVLPELLRRPGIFASLRRLRISAPDNPFSASKLQQLLCACPSLEQLHFIHIRIQDLPSIATLCLLRQQTLKTAEPFQIHFIGLMELSEETSLTPEDFGSIWDKVQLNEEALEEIVKMGPARFIIPETDGLTFCSCFKGKFELTIKSSEFDEKLSFKVKH